MKDTSPKNMLQKQKYSHRIIPEHIRLGSDTTHGTVGGDILNQQKLLVVPVEVSWQSVVSVWYSQHTKFQSKLDCQPELCLVYEDAAAVVSTVSGHSLGQ